MGKKLFDSKLAILPIGSLSTTLGIHRRTLRIYDKEGILVPTRTAKNRRSYTLDDLEKGKLILFLTRNLALNLAGVKIIMALLEDNKIEPENYMEYISKIAQVAHISTKDQKENIKKTSSRGRKPKNKAE